MATSGNFLTSDSGQGGGNYYGRMIFEWWQVNSGISGSVGYHGINYHLKTYGGSSGYWQYFFQGSMNVDGSGYSWGTTQAYGNGATVFGDYGKTLYTNGNGDRSFGASAQGGIYNNTINTSGSGSWSLDHINLWGGVDYINVPSPLTDESGAIVVGWHHYAGTAHLWYRLDQIDSGDSTFHYAGMGSPHTFSGYQSWVQSKMTNLNNSVLYIYYGDDIDNNGSVDNWQGPWTYGISIANGSGQANPTFSNFTYLDTNSTTSTLTGNNQVLIQGKSTLEATVSTGNKATANKQATMSTYTFTIGGYTQSQAWSNVASVVQTIGTVSDVSGSQNLSVRANDSRTNSTTVTKSVNVLPYVSPAFVPTLNVGYLNNYDTANGLLINTTGTTLANISPLTLSGTDKNVVNTSTGVKFDISKGSNTAYTGTMVNVPITQVAGTGAINSTSLSTLATAILTKMNGIGADNTVRWYVKFQITDSLETQTYETYIDIGRSIFRIGVDAKVYNNEEQLLVIPMVSKLADSVASAGANGTGTITPWSGGLIKTLYVHHGTGTGNSSTIVFDVAFSFWVNATASTRSWALKLDGVAVGNSSRPFFVNAIATHVPLSATVVATGVTAGTHTVSIELYGGGNDVRTDTADYLTIVATEYANAYVS